MDRSRVAFEIRTIMTTRRTTLRGIKRANVSEPWLITRVDRHALERLSTLERHHMHAGEAELRLRVAEARAEVRRATASRRPI